MTPSPLRKSCLHVVSAAALAMLLHAGIASAAEDEVQAGAPDRAAGEGEGPFERLVIRGAMLIDGTGAPPRGPVDIVIEGNRIVEVESVGYPLVEIKEDERPDAGDREIDASGSYVLPGFVNNHVHAGGVPKAPEAEYPYKLWMAHGITTVRGVPAGPMNWTLNEKRC